MIIEKNKYYIRLKNNYIVDVVSYNPSHKDYMPFEIQLLPQDILNKCYQLINNKLILDEAKHQMFLQELQKYEQEGDAHV